MKDYTRKAAAAANGIDFLTEILRKGARDVLAAALQAEVECLLAAYKNERDEHGHRRLVRNGYLPEREFTTPLGPIPVKAPRVRDRSKSGQKIKFESQILPHYLRRSKQIEELLPWLYLKGISSGDFGEALSALLGPGARGLTASTICRLKEIWQSEYELWGKRDLSKKRYIYVWADGIYFGVRGENADQCMLVLIGVLEDGTKELVGIHEGYSESCESWSEFFKSLKFQGLDNSPELVIGDGTLGLWKALGQIFPGSRGQRCWVHKTKNVMNYLPKSKHGQARAMLKEIWNSPTKSEAKKGIIKFETLFTAKYPKAVESLAKDEETLLTFYDFPAEHWTHLRTTNPIESTFATVRLRTCKTRGMSSRRTIGSMVFKLCQSSSKGWRKLNAPQRLLEIASGLKFENGTLLGDLAARDKKPLLAA